MERTKKKVFKKADGIFCADIHLHEESAVPVCRTDDFDAEQWRKLDFISALQKDHDCPVIHGGDLFDFWKPSPDLLSKAIVHLPYKFYSIYGDHDLPQHNLLLKNKSGLYTLEKANKAIIINGGHGNDKSSNALPTKVKSLNIKNRNIMVWHVLTWKNKLPFPKCTSKNAQQLLKKYPEYDLIVTGDNHKPFIENYKGRILVNSGSMMRLAADQLDHRPRVYLWYAETNTVEPVYIPINKDAISLAHLELVKERDNRIDAFISTLDNDWKASLSFEDNLEKFIESNDVEDDVIDIIASAMDIES